jgi:hypothetical protein
VSSPGLRVSRMCYSEEEFADPRRCATAYFLWGESRVNLAIFPYRVRYKVFNICWNKFVIHYSGIETSTLRRPRPDLGSCATEINRNLYASKGKAVPLQAWSGPEGSRKLRFPDFLTTAQYGGKVVNPTHRPPLPPGNTPGTHFC